MWGVLVFKEIKVILLGLLPSFSCLSLAVGIAWLGVQSYLLDFSFFTNTELWSRKLYHAILSFPRNHRMVWVGRELKNWVPTSLPWASPLSSWPWTLQGRVIHKLLGKLFKCLTSLTEKNFFLPCNLNQFKAIPPCPITTWPCEKTLSSFLVGPC